MADDFDSLIRFHFGAGSSDRDIARLTGSTLGVVRAARRRLGLKREPRRAERPLTLSLALSDAEMATLAAGAAERGRSVAVHARALLFGYQPELYPWEKKSGPKP